MSEVHVVHKDGETNALDYASICKRVKIQMAFTKTLHP